MAKRARKNELMTVGWEEWMALPELGLHAIKAKVDTGARTSALHAFSIEEIGTGKNRKVHFGIHPIPEQPEIEVYCTAQWVGEREVTSSNGHSEIRPVIRTVVRLDGQEWPIEVSLTNRESMSYRMLLGRSAMKDKVVVNPFEAMMCGELSPGLYDKSEVDDDDSRPLRIAILSREPDSYSTSRLVETAVSRGHTVQVINTTRCYMNITSARPEIHYQGDVLPKFDAVIPRVGASVTFYGMAVVRQFEMMGVYCLNGSAAIGASRDKLYAHQLLARAGIGMPVTGFAHSPSDVKDMLKTVGKAPLVLKLLEGTQGKGVVLAETMKAAESVIQAFRGLRAHIMVQEFIEEANGADIRCMVVGNKVVGAMKRQAAAGDFRSNLHQGGESTKVRISAQERATALRAMKTMGLRWGGVDLLRSNDGPKVLEVNSSPGLQGIETATGKNITGTVIDYVEASVRSAATRKKKRKS
jgi:ribosomal protein S6--L-glutamate ligase